LQSSRPQTEQGNDPPGAKSIFFRRTVEAQDQTEVAGAVRGDLLQLDVSQAKQSQKAKVANRAPSP
jgi:hypothetical protein